MVDIESTCSWLPVALPLPLVPAQCVRRPRDGPVRCGTTHYASRERCGATTQCSAVLITRVAAGNGATRTAAVAPRARLAPCLPPPLTNADPPPRPQTSTNCAAINAWTVITDYALLSISACCGYFSALGVPSP
jgi:hypothetical protein